jgi:predicted DNA-binding transcriptional regulator AlpA
MRYEPAVNVVLRLGDAETFSGMAKSTLRESIAEGNFPRPFLLRDGGRCRASRLLKNEFLRGWRYWGCAMPKT